MKAQRKTAKPTDVQDNYEACLEEANEDAAFIAKGLGDIARAKGMSQVAHYAGISLKGFSHE